MSITLADMKVGYALLSDRYPALLAWLRQTSTIAGLMGLAGVVASLMTGQADIATSIPIITASLVGLLLPGHPEAAASVRQAAVDAVQLAHVETRGAALRAMPADLVEVANGLGLDPAAVAAGRASVGLVAKGTTPG